MKRLTHLAVIVAIIFGVATAWESYAQDEAIEGDGPYTPTKLEWLALQMNVHQSESDGIQVVYQASRDKKNTMSILLMLGPNVDHDDPRIDELRTHASKAVKHVGRDFGWNCVKTEVLEVHSQMSK